MRDEIAIVELDTAPHAAAIQAALAALREARSHEDRASERLETARQATARARIDLGRALMAARELWPARGPRAKGWGAFLADQRVDQDVALDAMKYAGFVEARFTGTYREISPDELPTLRDAGIDQRRLGSESPVVKPANVFGGSGDPERGAYCTPKWLAEAVGGWDLDPFANPRSHVIATTSCMLERGDDGLAGPQIGEYWLADGGRHRATVDTRVWGQPPYEIVEEAIAHYGHTRFCFLLRFDPSTQWFRRLYELTCFTCVPIGRRLDFEPPPGIQASANPFPHALFYARSADVTEEVRRLCIGWPVEHEIRAD